MNFTDKTIIITGGTRGIGAAMVNAFCNAGANVVVTGTKKTGVETLDVPDSQDNIQYHQLDYLSDVSVKDFRTENFNFDIPAGTATVILSGLSHAYTSSHNVSAANGVFKLYGATRFFTVSNSIFSPDFTGTAQAMFFDSNHAGANFTNCFGANFTDCFSVNFKNGISCYYVYRNDFNGVDVIIRTGFMG